MTTRQQRYHEAQKKRGRKRVQVWVHASRVDELHAVAEAMRDSKPSNPPGEQEPPCFLNEEV